MNFVPASAAAFFGVKASLASTHSLRTIAGIKSGAYSYLVGQERYLYVLDGAYQVQLFATVALAKLEKVAIALPLLG
jgi:hypothetical protein